MYIIRQSQTHVVIMLLLPIQLFIYNTSEYVSAAKTGTKYYHFKHCNPKMCDHHILNIIPS